MVQDALILYQYSISVCYIKFSEYHGEASQIAVSPKNLHCSVEQHIFGHNIKYHQSKQSLICVTGQIGNHQNCPLE